MVAALQVAKLVHHAVVDHGARRHLSFLGLRE